MNYDGSDHNDEFFTFDFDQGQDEDSHDESENATNRFQNIRASQPSNYKNNRAFRPEYDAFVFVIDFRNSMRINSFDNGVAWLSASLKYVGAVLREKIIVSERDLIAVVAFGCKKSNNDADFPNLMILKELEGANARSIAKIEQYADNEKKREEELGHGQDDMNIQFHQVLMTCKHLFSMARKGRGLKSILLARKRIFVFTDDDDPCKGNENYIQRAITQANDLAQDGTFIELFNLSPMDSASSHPDPKSSRVVFDTGKFYDDIIFEREDEYVENANMKSFKDFDQLINRARKKHFHKRPAGKLTFNLAHNISISVAYFSQIQIVNPRTSAVKLELENQAPVRIEWEIKDEIDFEDVAPQELRWAAPFYDTDAIFTAEEMSFLKNLNVSQGLHLCGFADLDTLRRYHNLKLSKFVYPDDSRVSGSTTLFVSLHEELLAQNKYAVAIACFQKKGSLSLVALVPQRETFNVDGSQDCAPGMNLIQLPFADDYRYGSKDLARKSWKYSATSNQDDWDKAEETNNEPGYLDEDILGTCREMLKRIELDDFKCENYYDPNIQRHYSALHEIVLGADEDNKADQVPNYLKPDEKGIRNSAHDSLVAFKTATLGEDFDGATFTCTKANLETAKKKRKRMLLQESKKQEAQENLDQLDIDFQTHALAGTLPSILAKNLKLFCEAHDLKKLGDKNALCARIRKYYGVENEEDADENQKEKSESESD